MFNRLIGKRSQTKFINIIDKIIETGITQGHGNLITKVPTRGKLIQFNFHKPFD